MTAAAEAVPGILAKRARALEATLYLACAGGVVVGRSQAEQDCLLLVAEAFGDQAVRAVKASWLFGKCQFGNGCTARTVAPNVRLCVSHGGPPEPGRVVPLRPPRSSLDDPRPTSDERCQCGEPATTGICPTCEYEDWLRNGRPR